MMKSRQATTVLSLLLSLLLAAGGTTACGKESAAETPEKLPAETAAALDAEEEPSAGDSEETPAAVFPDEAKRLTDISWTSASADAVGSLTFDGGNAELNLMTGGTVKTLSGPASFSGKTMTVGGQQIGWAVVASFCKLTVDGKSYSFTKAADADTARAPFELVTGTWEGDGASLSFKGGTASLSVDSEGSWTGTWELDGEGTLTISENSGGEAGVNLAPGSKVTASSQETEDFPGPLAADGDLGTRWSSEYTDPSWLLLDLGSVKKVGAAVIYFETAASADFTLETSSDGVNFKEAATVRGNAAAGVDNPVTVLFREAADCRYVRFTGLARATQWGHSIYELELYAYIPGEAVCSLSYGDGEIGLTINGRTFALTKKS